MIKANLVSGTKKKWSQMQSHLNIQQWVEKKVGRYTVRKIRIQPDQSIKSIVRLTQVTLGGWHAFCPVHMNHKNCSFFQGHFWRMLMLNNIGWGRLYYHHLHAHGFLWYCAIHHYQYAIQTRKNKHFGMQFNAKTPLLRFFSHMKHFRTVCIYVKESFHNFLAPKRDTRILAICIEVKIGL